MIEKQILKILFLPNWCVKKINKVNDEMQSPDYYIEERPYWFFKYFNEEVEVNIIDVNSIPCIEKFEKYVLRFYVIQALRAIPKLNKYDIVISHGVQSGVIVSLWRRLFRTKSKHIVFDIGSFNSAAEKGSGLKLMQYASKSMDRLIYHTKKQKKYYEKYYPWLLSKASFVKFGTDIEYFDEIKVLANDEKDTYILCIGYSKRDWDTLLQAFIQIDTNIKLKFVGHVNPKYKMYYNVEQIPYMPINELRSQIKNAKFCVLPLESFDYSYGQMTLLQQMSMKKCVLTAKVPSLVDYIEDGVNAVFYEPKNINDLKEKLIFLLENNHICAKIGAKGREYLELDCNEKIMALEVEMIINTYLNRKEYGI